MSDNGSGLGGIQESLSSWDSCMSRTYWYACTPCNAAQATNMHSQQMASNRRHHPGQHPSAVHPMVRGQMHMWWYCGLLLWLLRLLLFTTEQERISTTCTTTSVPYAQPILWSAATHVLCSTNVRTLAHVCTATDVWRRRQPWRAYEPTRRTKGWFQRRRASCFSHAHSGAPLR